MYSDTCIKAATSRFAHIEKFSLKFSNSSFVIRVNLFHPWPSLFFYGLPLSLWCFSILLNCFLQVSYHLMVILYVAKITQNTMTELLQADSLSTLTSVRLIHGCPLYTGSNTLFNNS